MENLEIYKFITTFLQKASQSLPVDRTQSIPNFRSWKGYNI